jgi:hypothetical protein
MKDFCKIILKIILVVNNLYPIFTFYLITQGNHDIHDFPSNQSIMEEIIKTEKDLIAFYIGRIKGVISLKEILQYDADELVRVLKDTLTLGEELRNKIKENKTN